jgi:cystathionine beta-lyase/cystathionine gamma-synthase
VRPDSLLIRGAGDSEDGEGLSPVLDRSTSFERWSNRTSPYARAGSPTAAEAEALLGALEQAHALTFASGMTAWSGLCFAVLSKGSILVIPDSGYYEVELLAAGPLTALGVEVRRYSPTDPDAFATACQGARLALIETPANPLMHIVDLDRAVRDAHAGGALLCCDNTVATPLLQRPLEHGADVTWQSATKSLAGHSDTLAGVLSVRDDELHGQILATRRLLGGVLAPDPAWLLLRGLRTLSVRLERQCAGALELAGRLAEHPEVRTVHYPGLPTHPNHDVARRQMHGRYGSLLSFELPDAERAEQVEDRLRLIRRATSLGSVETLIERRGRVEPTGRVPEGLLRLSVGLEDREDLWDDLRQALDATR